MQLLTSITLIIVSLLLVVQSTYLLDKRRSYINWSKNKDPTDTEDKLIALKGGGIRIAYFYAKGDFWVTHNGTTYLPSEIVYWSELPQHPINKR